MEKTVFHGNFKTLYATVREHLSDSGSCHDFDHTLRVMGNAIKLLEQYPQADREMVILGALLHDIGRPEEEKSRGKICHAAAGANMVKKMLADHGFPEDFTAPVAEIVRCHRFRGKNEPQTIEEKIVFDADKLDSLGAIGLGRAFVFAGRENARVHNTESEALNGKAYSKEDTAFREYLVKLRFLPRRMQTVAGRKEAVERAGFMADFFEKINQETFLGDIEI